MGCASSKALADVPAAASAAPPPAAPPPAPLPPAYLVQAREAAAPHTPGEPSTAPPGRSTNWAERPDELRERLLGTAIGDRRVDEFLVAIVDVAKRSYKTRIQLCDKDVVQRLVRTLGCGLPSTVKAASQALKMLSFCPPNHPHFSCPQSVQGLIAALSSPDYRVQTAALSTLCNLSATPRIVSPSLHSYHEREALLEALVRVLMQTRLDPDPQANATQLLLNLTTPLPTDDGGEELLVGVSKETATTTTVLTHASVRSHPTRHSDATVTQSSQLTVRSQPTGGLTKDTDRMASPHEDDGADTNLSIGYGGYSHSAAPPALALVATTLQVLRDAPLLEREAREECIEVLLNLLQAQTPMPTLNPQVEAYFVAQGGIAVVMAEALREGVLASTLVLICDILRLLGRKHFAALSRAKLVHAVSAMLTFRTPRGADERMMDVDVQHATLMLAQQLCEEGDPREQQQLAQEVVQHLPDCLAGSCVSVHLAACQLMKLYHANPATRHSLRGVEIAKRLVTLNTQRHPLTVAPAVACIGILSELRSDAADAVIRADGVNAMLRTLEEDCAAQAQRHALVSITKVLQRAHAHVLSPEVQGGRTVQLAVSVLQHTAHSGVTSQAQWRAWCCRVLRDAASVDDKCTAKVVSVLSKKPDVLKLIGVQGAASSEAVIAALQRGASHCSPEFLAVVADLQTLEEAVATELVRGRHALLAAKGGSPESRLVGPPAVPGAKSPASPAEAPSMGGKSPIALPRNGRLVERGPVAPGASSGMLGGKSAGTSMIANADGERTHTFLSTRTAHGSTADVTRETLNTTVATVRESPRPHHARPLDVEQTCNGEHEGKASHDAEAGSGGAAVGFSVASSDFARRSGSGAGGGVAARGGQASPLKVGPLWDGGGGTEGGAGMVAVHPL